MTCGGCYRNDLRYSPAGNNFRIFHHARGVTVMTCARCCGGVRSVWGRGGRTSGEGGASQTLLDVETLGRGPWRRRGGPSPPPTVPSRLEILVQVEPCGAHIASLVRIFSLSRRDSDAIGAQRVLAGGLARNRLRRRCRLASLQAVPTRIFAGGADSHHFIALARILSSASRS